MQAELGLVKQDKWREIGLEEQHGQAYEAQRSVRER